MTKKELIEALAEYPDTMTIIKREEGHTQTLIAVDIVDPIEVHVINKIAYDCGGALCIFCHSNPNSTVVTLPILVFE